MLRLRVMGIPSVERDGIPLSGRATQRRRLALLALLSVARDRGVSRDRCIAFLWPDHDEDRGRHSLSQLLYGIRHELGPVVINGIDEIRLNPAGIISDVGLFEEALDRDDLQGAIAEYGGPFLDGVALRNGGEFDAWVSTERARLAAAYADALVRLTRQAELQADDTDAIRLWRLRAALDPLSPTAAAGLVGALARSGDLDGARQHAEEHARRVRAEVGIEPDPRVTLALNSVATPGRVQRAVGRGKARWHVAAILLALAAAGAVARAKRPKPLPARALVLALHPGADPLLDSRVIALLTARLKRDAGLVPMPDSTLRRTLQEMRWPTSSVLGEELDRKSVV